MRVESIPSAGRATPGPWIRAVALGSVIAMTESSAYLLRNQLPASLREDVIRALFSPTEGIGLSFLRIPIGASDYVVGEPATPDDQPPGGPARTPDRFEVVRAVAAPPSPSFRRG